MEKKALILMLLIGLMLSCQSEGSSLIVTADLSHGESCKIILTGKDCRMETEAYSGTAVFGSIREGIYTLEAIEYGNGKIAGYEKRSIRIYSGENSVKVSFSKTMKHAEIKVSAGNEYRGRPVKLSVGFASYCSFLDSYGEASFIISLEEEQIGKASISVECGNGETLEKDLIIDFRFGETYIISINESGYLEGDAVLSIQDMHHSPIEGRIGIKAIDRAGNMLTLYFAHNEEINEKDAEYRWYVNGCYEKDGKYFTLSPQSSIRRIDTIMIIGGFMAVGSASMVFSN